MSGTAHPHLPGVLAAGRAFGDSRESWPVARSEVIHSSPYLSLSIDSIVDPTGIEHARAVARPHGAVGVVAIDSGDNLLLVEQYRHPVRRRLLEIPAGTLDVEGESPRDAAIRELGEEADIRASSWRSLLTMLATPGYSSEGWEVFTASGLSAIPAGDRMVRVAEEADMRQLWVPFGDAVEAVLDGRISDGMTVSAILATALLRRANR